MKTNINWEAVKAYYLETRSYKLTAEKFSLTVAVIKARRYREAWVEVSQNATSVTPVELQNATPVTPAELQNVTPATRMASRFVTLVTFVTLILNFYIRERKEKKLKFHEERKFIYAYIGGNKTGQCHVTTSRGGEVEP